MENDRREFLKKFALLSSASFALTGCVNTTYGPQSINDDVMVFYRNSQGVVEELDGKTDMPLNLTIELHFLKPMSEDAKESIHMRDSNKNSINYKATWKSKNILEITPQENEINSDTFYTIEIENSLKAEDGSSIITDPLKQYIARFKTL